MTSINVGGFWLHVCMANSGLDDIQDTLVDMSAGDVLAFVEDRHAARLDAERDILRAAYQWAVLHNPDSLPETDKRGRDRARPAGAEGTPRITEYAAAAFGARIQTSPYGAKRLIADAVDLHHRLPKLWAGVQAGTVRSTHARHVAEKPPATSRPRKRPGSTTNGGSPRTDGWRGRGSRPWSRARSPPPHPNRPGEGEAAARQVRPDVTGQQAWCGDLTSATTSPPSSSPPPGSMPSRGAPATSSRNHARLGAGPVPW